METKTFKKYCSGGKKQGEKCEKWDTQKIIKYGIIWSWDGEAGHITESKGNGRSGRPKT